MARISRGQFLGFGAALAGGFGIGKSGVGTLASAEQPAPSVGAEPDIVVHNARVFTIDPALPRAEAFAVKNGRFTAVGSSADVRNLATARTRVIDAQQATVTPGFIDTHCHVSGVNELYAVDANVRRVRELLNNLRQKADKTPAGMWVTAVMFDDTKLDVPLTRQHLDEVSREHPIVGRTPWRPHKLVQHQGLRARWRHQEHTRSRPWSIFPRSERRADGPRCRARAQRIRQGRPTRDVHARAAARARPQRNASYL